MIDRLKLMAIHEAGHALIFWYEGFVLGEVSCLRPFDLPGEGVCRAHGGTDQGGAALVHALLAGKAATDLLMPGGEADMGHRGDFAEAYAKARPDLETIDLLRWLDANPKSSPDDLYRFMKPKIGAIIGSRRGKRALKALAKELLKVGSLSGQTAVGILEAAWGQPLPGKALPVGRHLSLTMAGPRTYEDFLIAVKQYVALMKKDAKALRDTGTDDENENLDRLWGGLLHLEFLIKWFLALLPKGGRVAG